ncbi:MAG TPA: hypothetical protein PLS53_11815 [Thermoanaerobaculaceae bacterium]|nr:hypothetical protein [Thermoanaerobaculaceae bacterium]HPS78834.1 hypothetical protein [Thermoanaerobaculaceae bacterium]
MTCDECGTDAHAQPYDDPDTDGTLNLCERCAADIVGEPTESLAADDSDDEFVDACITAADYMRADGDW